jgi:hypothetical protein
VVVASVGGAVVVVATVVVADVVVVVAIVAVSVADGFSGVQPVSIAADIKADRMNFALYIYILRGS